METNRKSKNMGPAPLAVDFNPSRTTQMFHVEEHIEIIPVVPSQPPPRPYSASAYPKNAQNSSASPYASPSSPYNAPYVTHTNFYPNQELHNSIEDPMYPDNYGVYGVPLELQIHQDACFDDSNVRETYALTPALLDSHKSAANEKIGPVVSLSKIPPSTEGFFGMWDRKGGFHQGFVDQDLYVHGGIFDDQCYFHFGAIGEDAVFVEDSMMACPDDIKAAARSDMPLDTLRDSRSYVGKANNEIGGVPSASASFLDLHHQEENIREGGESMDVFACSVQSPRYI